jgi:hypothetical protein
MIEFAANKQTVTVKFSCALCGLYRVECLVPERDADQGVVPWMENVTWLISREHDRLSPDCHPPSLSELLVPMTGRPTIGGPVVQ